MGQSSRHRGLTPAARSAVHFTLAAATAAALGVMVVYAGQIDVGLRYDDYHFVRPWSAIDLRRVWFGAWDPTGIEPIFFRPLAAWLFAGRFWLFGLNTMAMHGASIAGHVACAVLVGWFLRRERVSTAVALLGVLVYALHPGLPFAQVSWLTNQMHLVASLLVLAALLVWQSARDRTTIWWIPIVLMAVVAFLIKEDGLLLLPAIVCLTALRVWLLSAPPPSRWPVALGCAVLVVGALVALRQDRLGELGGYGAPDLAVSIANLLKGPETALLLWPTRRPWQAVASLMAIGGLVSGLVLARDRRSHWLLTTVGVLLTCALATNVRVLFDPWPEAYAVLTWQGVASGVATTVLVVGLGIALWRRDRHSLFLIGAGLVITLSFNTLFVFVSKREQYHLLTLGAVIAFAGAGHAMRGLLTSRDSRGVLLLTAGLACLPLAATARIHAADFRPCAVADLDKEARGWWVVPEEIRSWMDTREARCGAGQQPEALVRLPVVTWGAYEPIREDSSPPYRWTSDRVVLLLAREMTSVTLALRRPDATGARPVPVRISSARRTTRLALDDAHWHHVTVALGDDPMAWFRQSQRLDVEVETWFVPAVRDPASSDLRRFGVQMQVIDRH